MEVNQPRKSAVRLDGAHAAAGRVDVAQDKVLVGDKLDRVLVGGVGVDVAEHHMLVAVDVRVGAARHFIKIFVCL